MAHDPFPNRADHNFTPTSPVDTLYNCAAWSVGYNDQIIWPDNDHRWPVALARDDTVAGFEAFFSMLGYSSATHSDLEQGFEKIALYAVGGYVAHLARQLPNGRWTSKMGPSGVDATHTTLRVLEDGPYGVVQKILKRKVDGKLPALPAMKPDKPRLVTSTGGILLR